MDTHEALSDRFSPHATIRPSPGVFDRALAHPKSYVLQEEH
jgi:hypothetical protein